MAVNIDPVDGYTLVHAAFGAAMGAAKMPWWGALIVAVGWEIIENPLKDAFPQVLIHNTRDSPMNAVLDATAVMGGWYVADRWRG